MLIDADESKRKRRAQSLHVGSKTRKANIKLVVDAEDLLEVCAECLALHAKATVGGNRDAAVADHGNHGRTIIFGNALK